MPFPHLTLTPMPQAEALLRCYGKGHIPVVTNLTKAYLIPLALNLHFTSGLHFIES